VGEAYRKEEKMALNNAVKSRNNTEQCVNQSEEEPRKGREIPKKLIQRAKELSKLIPVTKLMYSRARTVI